MKTTAVLAFLGLLCGVLPPARGAVVFCFQSAGQRNTDSLGVNLDFCTHHVAASVRLDSERWDIQHNYDVMPNSKAVLSLTVNNLRTITSTRGQLSEGILRSLNSLRLTHKLGGVIVRTKAAPLNVTVEAVHNFAAALKNHFDFRVFFEIKTSNLTRSDVRKLGAFGSNPNTASDIDYYIFRTRNEKNVRTYNSALPIFGTAVDNIDNMLNIMRAVKIPLGKTLLMLDLGGYSCQRAGNSTAVPKCSRISQEKVYWSMNGNESFTLQYDAASLSQYAKSDSKMIYFETVTTMKQKIAYFKSRGLAGFGVQLVPNPEDYSPRKFHQLRLRTLQSLVYNHDPSSSSHMERSLLTQLRDPQNGYIQLCGGFYPDYPKYADPTVGEYCTYMVEEVITVRWPAQNMTEATLTRMEQLKTSLGEQRARFRKSMPLLGVIMSHDDSPQDKRKSDVNGAAAELNSLSKNIKRLVGRYGYTGLVISLSNIQLTAVTKVIADLKRDTMATIFYLFSYQDFTNQSYDVLGRIDRYVDHYVIGSPGYQISKFISPTTPLEGSMKESLSSVLKIFDAETVSRDKLLPVLDASVIMCPIAGGSPGLFHYLIDKCDQVPIYGLCKRTQAHGGMKKTVHKKTGLVYAEGAKFWFNFESVESLEVKMRYFKGEHLRGVGVFHIPVSPLKEEIETSIGALCLRTVSALVTNDSEALSQCQETQRHALPCVA